MSAPSGAGALGVFLLGPCGAPGNVQVLGLGLCCFSWGFGVRLLPQQWRVLCPHEGREVTVPGEYASSAAGTPSGHRGRGGLACAQATEPLPQPDFLPAAFFFALKPPSPRAVSLTGALHEGFGLPAMNGNWGCWWRA